MATSASVRATFQIPASPSAPSYQLLLELSKKAPIPILSAPKGVRSVALLPLLAPSRKASRLTLLVNTPQAWCQTPCPQLAVDTACAGAAPEIAVADTSSELLRNSVQKWLATSLSPNHIKPIEAFSRSALNQHAIVNGVSVTGVLSTKSASSMSRSKYRDIYVS